jgi:DNA repair exonuclease SbcCD nuclease subunit
MRECNGLLFIGDPHLDHATPGRRLDDNFAETVLGKLDFIIEHANKNDLVPVFLGDMFDKNVVSKWIENRLARILMKSKHKPISNVGNHDKKDKFLNDQDSLMSYSINGTMHVALEAGPVEMFKINGKVVGLGASPYDQAIPVDVRMYFDKPDMVVWITHHDLAFGSAYPGAEPLTEIKGCRLAVNGHMHLSKLPVAVGETTWFNPGNITRQEIDALEHEPCVYEFSPTRALTKVVVPHKQGVFNLKGKYIDAVSPGEPGSVKTMDEDSDFVAILRAEDAMEMQKTDDGSVAREEIEDKFERDNTHQDIKNIVMNLFATVQAKIRAETVIG